MPASSFDELFEQAESELGKGGSVDKPEKSWDALFQEAEQEATQPEEQETGGAAKYLDPFRGPGHVGSALAREFREDPDQLASNLQRLGSQAFRAVAQGVADMGRAKAGRAQAEIERSKGHIAKHRGEEEYFHPKYKEVVFDDDPEKIKAAEKYQDMLYEARGGEAASRERIERLGDKKEAAEEFAGKMPEFLPGQMPGGWGFAEEVAKGVPRFAVGMGATALSPSAGPLVIYQQIYGSQYDEAVKQGAPPERADEAALIAATLSTPIEYMGTLVGIGGLKGIAKVAKNKLHAKGILMKKLPEVFSGKAARVVGNIAKIGVAEGMEEMLQTYPEAFANIYAKNPDKSVEEVIKQFKEELPEIKKQSVHAFNVGAVGGVALGGLGAGVAGGVKGAAKLADKRKAKDKEQQEIFNEALMEQLMGEEEAAAEAEQAQPEPEDVTPPEAPAEPEAPKEEPKPAAKKEPRLGGPSVDQIKRQAVIDYLDEQGLFEEAEAEIQKEVTSAEGLRKDAGQIQRPRDEREGREEKGGPDLEQPAPEAAGDEKEAEVEAEAKIPEPEAPAKPKTESKKEKSLREYREYVASLTDEQRSAVADLVEDEPKSPGMAKFKIKQRLSQKPKKKTSHDYGSTQVRLPEETARKVTEFGAKIPEEEVYTRPDDSTYGREKEPHITVRYGLSKEDVQKVAPALKALGPIKAKLGKVSVFENDDYDVVKVEAEGEDLRRVNKIVGTVADLPGETFKDYQPHATISYVKKGQGKKYEGDASFEGEEVTFDQIELSDHHNVVQKIDLQKPIPEPEAPAKPKTEAEKEASEPDESKVIFKTRDRGHYVDGGAEAQIREDLNRFIEENKNAAVLKKINGDDDVDSGWGIGSANAQTVFPLNDKLYVVDPVEGSSHIRQYVVREVDLEDVTPPDSYASKTESRPDPSAPTPRSIFYKVHTPEDVERYRRDVRKALGIAEPADEGVSFEPESEEETKIPEPEAAAEPSKEPEKSETERAASSDPAERFGERYSTEMVKPSVAQFIPFEHRYIAETEEGHVTNGTWIVNKDDLPAAALARIKKKKEKKEVQRTTPPKDQIDSVFNVARKDAEDAEYVFTIKEDHEDLKDGLIYPQAVYQTESGSLIPFNGYMTSYLKKVFKDLKIKATDTKTLALLLSGGKEVGVLMPMSNASDSKYSLEGLEVKRPADQPSAEPAPEAAPEEGAVSAKIEAGDYVKAIKDTDVYGKKPIKVTWSNGERVKLEGKGNLSFNVTDFEKVEAPGVETKPADQSNVDTVIDELLEYSAEEAARAEKSEAKPRKKPSPATVGATGSALGEGKDKVKQGLSEISAGVKAFNEIFGEKGAIGNQPADPEMQKKVHDALAQIWGGVKLTTEGLQDAAKEFIRIAYSQLSARGKPYIDRFIKEDIRAELAAEMGEKPEGEAKIPEPEAPAEPKKTEEAEIPEPEAPAEPETETKTEEAEQPETEDLTEEAAKKKKRKRSTHKIEDVGEERWKRSSKDNRTRTEAIKEEISLEDADAKTFVTAIRNMTTGIVKIPSNESTTPGCKRYAKWLRSQIKSFVRSEARCYTYYSVQGSFEDRLVNLVETGSLGKDTLTNKAAEYVSALELLNEAVAEATTVRSAREAIISMYYIDEEHSRASEAGQTLGRYGIDKSDLSERKLSAFEKDELERDKNQPIRRSSRDLSELTPEKSYRKDKDISPDQLMKTFSLGTVAFGEWAKGAHGQDSLNLSYDAFHDLIKVIGANKPGVSLNKGKRLGLMFGARGRGGRSAAAFYPDDYTINLTKTAGDGSLAHEWGHALDFMARDSLKMSNNVEPEYHQYNAVQDFKHALKYKYDLSNVDKIVDEILRGISSEVRKTSDPLADARKFLSESLESRLVSQTEYHSDAIKLDGGVDNSKADLNESDFSNKYWSTKAEMFARAFETFVADELQGANPYLVDKTFVTPGYVSEQFNWNADAYPKAEERQRFNEMFRYLFDNVTWEKDGTPQISPDYVPFTIKEAKEAEAVIKKVLDELEDRYNSIYQGEASADGLYWYAYQHTTRGEMMQPDGFVALDDHYKPTAEEGQPELTGSGAIGYTNPIAAADVVKHGLTAITHEKTAQTFYLEETEDEPVWSNGEETLGNISAVDGAGASGRGGVRGDTGEGGEESLGYAGRPLQQEGGESPGSDGSDTQAGDRTAEREGDGDPASRSDALLDHAISTTDGLTGRTPVQLFTDALAAIRTLKKIEAEGRLATSVEQQVLARMPGWASIQDALESPRWAKEAWKARAEMLQAELTKEEISEARRGVITSYHTPPDVAAGIYEGISRFGFTGGRVLDPACGDGLFAGMMPRGMLRRSSVTGIDADGLGVRFARQLYQNHSFFQSTFEEAGLPEDYYDLVITNVPFDESAPYDPQYNPKRFPLHDYYINKSVDLLRPGGLIAAVTSTGTMDKQKGVREVLNEKAEFVGAIRLPNGTFKTAGTETATDIVFLRKKSPYNPPIETPEWVNTVRSELPVMGQTYSEKVDVNEYFKKNPEMVLGDLYVNRGRWNDNRLNVIGKTDNLYSKIEEAAGRLSQNFYVADTQPHEMDLLEMLPKAEHVKNGSFFIDKQGRVVQQDGDTPVVYDTTVQTGANKGKKVSETRQRNADVIRQFITLRGIMRQLLRAQAARAGEAEVSKLQKSLNTEYDKFVKKFGWANAPQNLRAYGDDPDAGLVMGLEKWDPETETSLGKEAAFTENLISEQHPPTSANTAEEALAASLNFKARVDLEYISGLLGQSVQATKEQLRGHIFNDPQIGWVEAGEYLSGDVKTKLDIAKKAANTDPAYQENVDALEKVQPEDIPASEIYAELGSSWLPPEMITDFAKRMLSYKETDFQIVYMPGIEKWDIVYRGSYNYATGTENKASVKRRKDRARETYEATQKWGINHNGGNFFDLLYYALNGGTPTIKVRTGRSDKPVVSPTLTNAALEKLAAIKDEWRDWAWRDDSRAEKLTRIYNDTNNRIIRREHDTSPLPLPGKVPDIVFKMRPHQNAAIRQYLRNGTIYMGHDVGTGKTASMAACIMESRRLGLARRPVFPVLKSTLESIQREFQELYPGANLLVIEMPGNKAQRRKAMQKIISGNWDCVIMTHESFGKIPLKPETERRFIQQEVTLLEQAMETARMQRRARHTIREIEKRKKALESKIKALNDQIKEGKDEDIPTFEEMGFDMVVVDEAHQFKNLPFSTSFSDVKGINPVGSNRAMDMFQKTRYVLDNFHRGIIFASGTPVSNSVSELYLISRYLQPKELRRRKVYSFDSWAQTFGKIATEAEYAPEGGGFRNRTKFTHFVNMPELMQMIQQVLDIVRIQDTGIKLPDVDGPHNILVPQSRTVAEFQQQLKDRVIAYRESPADAEYDGRPDNLLRIINDGRNIAMHPKLADPSLPDEADSKVNYAADKIAELYKQEFDALDEDGKPYKEKKGVQLVYADRGVPGAGKEYDVYNGLKKKLVAKGVPAKEIAFIQDVGSDKAKRLRLFEKVRKGEVRVLIGSTQKIGTGVNIQDRVVAMHHLDVHWNWSAYEQRNGRGIRFGNRAQKIGVYNYGTEATVDVFMWDTVASKGRVINQALTRNVTARSVEDISLDEKTMSANEAVAAFANDPLMKEKFVLETEVDKLLSGRRLFDAQKQKNKSRLASLPSIIEGQEKAIKRYEAEAEVLSKVKAFWMEGAKDFFDLKKDGAKASEALNKINTKKLQKTLSPKKDQGVEGLPKKTVGEYGDIKTETVTDIVDETVKDPDTGEEKTVRKEVKSTVKRFVPLGIKAELGYNEAFEEVRLILNSPKGLSINQPVSNGISLSNTHFKETVEGRLESTKEDVKDRKQEQKDLAEAIKETYPKADELRQKQARLMQVTNELMLRDREETQRAGEGSDELYSKTVDYDLKGVSLEDIRSLPFFKGRQVVILPGGKIHVILNSQDSLVIKGIKGTADSVKLHLGYADRKTGEVIAGKYDGEIELSLLADKETVTHEVEHALETLGYINRVDQSVLDAAIRREKGKDATPGGKGREAMEARAQFVAEALGNREKVRGTALGRVLQKFVDFLDGIIGLAHRTARGVLRGIESGQILDQKAVGTVSVRRSVPQYESGAPRWYSELTRAVEQMKFKAAPAKDLLNRIKKTPGVKQEELDWTGLETWLAEHKGAVSKKEVLEYLAANQLELREVEKGDSTEFLLTGIFNETFETREQAENHLAMLKEQAETNPAIKKLLDKYPNKIIEQPKFGTKFGEYQLPGGENYFEFFLTAPNNRAKQAAEIVDTASVSYEEAVALEEKYGMTYKEALEERDDTAQWGDGHSAYSDIDNPVVRVRANSRTGPNGEKILFLEEVQGPQKKEQAKMPEFMQKPGFFAMAAMKRMVRYAAENGFDTLAWTPGEVQNDRYQETLRQNVDEIWWQPSTAKKDAPKEFSAEKDGKTVAYGAIADKGIITGANIGELNGKTVESVFGKEIANQMMQQDEGELSGSGLSVGGHGMIAFYDKMLPAMVNKFFNKGKWGKAKAHQVEIGEDKFWVPPEAAEEGAGFEETEKITAWTLPITPEMRQKALTEGMPLFEIKKLPSVIEENFGKEQHDVGAAVKSTLKSVGSDPNARKEIWDEAVTQLLDRLHPIRKKGGEKAYVLHRLETGSQGVFAMLLEHGKLVKDPSGLLRVNTRNEGFLPFLRDLGPDGHKFLYWVAAKRAEQLEAQGREKRLSREVRQQIYNWAGGEFNKKWTEAAKKLHEFNSSVLDVAETAGLIDPENRKTWEQFFYVPFYRVFKDETVKDEFLQAPHKSRRFISAQIRQLVGSEKKVGDPLENLLHNWMHLISESIRNEARAEAFNFAEQQETGIVQRIPYKEVIKLRGQKKKMGYATTQGDDNVLMFQDQGHPVYFQVHDPAFFQALSNLNAPNLDNFFIKMMGRAKRWLTYGATFGPAFRVANLLRDTMHTSLMEKSFVPFTDSAIGFWKAWREDEDFIAFMSSGAGFGSSYVEAENPRVAAKFIKRIVAKEGQGATENVLDTAEKVLKFWDKIGAASENAARVRLYQKLRKQGASHMEAGFRARDLLDFTMRGESRTVQFLTQTIPFLNARMQGLYKLGRAASAKENRANFLLWGGMLTAASMALWFWNRDREEYKALEDWERWAYYHFWIGDKHFRIPKPFEVGAIFSSFPEAVMDVLHGNNKTKHIAEFIAHTATQTFAIGLPQIFNPILEQGFNRSFFTGRPIINQRIAGLEAEEQYESYTSETMQLIGKAFNVSPKRAEHLVRGYFSTFGAFLLTGPDVLLHYALDFPEDPTKRIDDYPGIGRFARQKTPARYTRYQNWFYDVANEMDKTVQTINRYRFTGKMDEARQKYKDNREVFKARPYFSKLRRHLADLHKEIRRIRLDPEMTGAEKSERINGLLERRNKLVRQVYEKYGDTF